MDKIIEFFINLYNNHFYVIVISVILFSILIIGAIILSQIIKNQKEDKMYKENAKNAINSLTPEEIDNISQNVADKETLFELLSSKDEEIVTEKKTANKKLKSNVSSTNNKAQSLAMEEVAIVEDTPTNKSDLIKKQSQTKKKSTTKKSTTTKTVREYTGKWKIKQLNNKYFAELTASNGGLLLKTEQYTTLSSLKNGIESLKKNIESGNVVISLDKHGHYHYKIFTSTNRLLCISEDYSSKAKCENGILSVKRFSKSATIIMEEGEKEE